MTTTVTLTAETMTDRSVLDDLAEGWDELLTATPAVSGFQSHAWLTACWDELAPAGTRLFVTVVHRDGRLVGLFPTQLGAGGQLTFIGEGVSNYSGPVYEPEHLHDVVTAWATHVAGHPEVLGIDLSGLRGSSPFLAAVVGGPVGELGRAVVVRTNTCPEVELSSGWSALLNDHKSKQRANWKRKRHQLARLGGLRFLETSHPDEVEAALPRLSQLFRARWSGQRIVGGFTQGFETFQRKAARVTSEAGHVLLSLLLLDDEIIAYAYGIRAGGVTSSYLLAHDDRFASYSPGLLLLIDMLRAACERGDSAYDFSLGDTPYKAMWANRYQDVYQVFWGSRKRLRAAWSRAWVAARSVELLRRVKRQGLAGLRPSRPKALLPDLPGLPAGEGSRWFVHRVQAFDSKDTITKVLAFREMEALLSRRLLQIALDRNFRGDEMVQIVGPGGSLGVAWRAAGRRRKVVSGGHAASDPAVHVFYHPLPIRGPMVGLVTTLGEGEPCFVVGREPLAAPGIELVGSFSGQGP